MKKIFCINVYKYCVLLNLLCMPVMGTLSFQEKNDIETYNTQSLTNVTLNVSATLNPDQLSTLTLKEGYQQLITDDETPVQNCFKPSAKLIDVENFTPRHITSDGSVVYGNIDIKCEKPRAAKIIMAEPQKAIYLPCLYADDDNYVFFLTSDDSGSKKFGLSKSSTGITTVKWDYEEQIKKLDFKETGHNLDDKDFFIPLHSNSDGSVIVGCISTQIDDDTKDDEDNVKFACKLTSQGLERLPNLNGGQETFAYHIGSQSEIVGYAIDGKTGQKTATVWTADGIQPLPMLNSGHIAEALFSSQKSIIGYAIDFSDNNQSKCVQWIQGEIHPLQTFESQDHNDHDIVSVTRDGSLYFGNTGKTALIWVNEKVQTLASYLKDSKIFLTSDPAKIYCASPDGSYFVIKTQDKKKYVVHQPRLNLF